jgi:Mn2+/Fe2+ NRAMP family transporter
MKRILAIIGPGLLVAATGIGAGDLATASFAGSHLGTAVLWAVVVGALLKFVLTEGLARWQLATGSTLLEGVVDKFGRAPGWLFLAYLAFWSFFVGSALVSACGVALHALVPVFDNANTGKLVFGILSSLAGVMLVLAGGYALFSRVMQVCIGFMFLTVVFTAVLLWPGSSEVLRGLFIPTIPALDEGGLAWTVALMGGVGGTVTVLCYGYWIREEHRTGEEDLRTSRIDLASAYVVTALFGVAMVIVGSTIEVEGRGTTLLVQLAAQLEEALGPTGRWLFLAGAAGAVFSSLLGVWQAIPYLFADTWAQVRATPGEATGRSGGVDTRSLAYRGYLATLAVVPLAGLFFSFREVQKLYAVVGAWFIPALTLVLLVLNNRSDWVGERFRNGVAVNLVLVFVLVFFSWIAVRSV